MKRYNPKEIEPRWQKIWEESGIYKATEDKIRPKKYVLEYFPYPSGAAMHVGHVRNYTIGDTLSRFMRMQGNNVLHPMGWDAFGLPAENYAIKTGVSPQQAVAENVKRFKQQLMQMGFSYDWSREINSTDPDYYKWTQWFFIFLYKKGLAYQQESLQWWCPHDKTVLANEQVENGRCWRCGNLVEKKALKQWFFKITEYADRLDKDLEKLDWSPAIKAMQHNWIGKSSGAEIDFKVESTDKKITVFTTRPDTIFGATFIVVAPEHEILNKLSISEHVSNYIRTTERKSDIERQETNREKTGVFSGFYATNPANNEKIPIWVADYVLPGYGTGAIMAVPAHDERDYEFAKKFDLPVINVIAEVFGDPAKDETYVEGSVVMAYDPKTDKYLGLAGWNKGIGLAGGGLNKGETYTECALRELREEAGLSQVDQLIEISGPLYSHYYNDLKNVARLSLAPAYLAIVDSEKKQDLALEEHEKFHPEWFSLDEIKKGIQKIGAGIDHWLEICNRAEEAVKAYKEGREFEMKIFTGEGRLYNSGKYDKLTSAEVREQIVADLSGVNPLNPAKREFIKNESGEEEPVFIQTDTESAVREGQPFVERQAITALVKHWKEDTYIGLKWKTVDWETLITGGIEDGQTAEEAAIAEIREETGYKNPVLKKDLGITHAKFFHNPKNENRFAHFRCLYFELADGEHEEISDKEQKNHQVVWLSADEMDKFRLPDSHWYMWNLFNGRQPSAREKINYKIRDWLISRQRYWGAPIPIVHCEKCGAVPVPAKDLPVVLPEVKSYEPSGDGRSPLANVDEFVNVKCPKCGAAAQRETDTMDGFACSSWYFLRYADPHNNKEPFAKDKAEFWLPVDDYIGGAEHAVMHLLYARFWTKVMYDDGLVNFDEPFISLRNQGMILAPDGQKMSKSKGNTIEPDDLLSEGYGADSIRLMELFIGPWDQAVNWSVEGIGGTFRFLQRYWTLAGEFLESPQKENPKDLEITASVHKTIKKVTQDLRRMDFNTGVSAMMSLVNDLYKIKAEEPITHSAGWRFALETLTQLLAPFAPHITEEIWESLGHESSVHISNWPQWDENLVAEEVVTLAVQINGKVRSEIIVWADATEKEVIAAAKADEKVAPHLEGKTIKKEIYVPGRLVSLVI